MHRLPATFTGNLPASSSSIQQFESNAGLRLPEDYAEFLKQADGGEGFIGDSYLILWRVGELLELNTAYQAAEYAPGLFLFGSDGGGEAFAFDTRSEARPIVSVPFVGMDLSLTRSIADTFTEFLEELNKS
jgi:SMI1 / KNR4 family (SUKH-1)